MDPKIHAIEWYIKLFYRWIYFYGSHTEITILPFRNSDVKLSFDEKHSLYCARSETTYERGWCMMKIQHTLLWCNKCFENWKSHTKAHTHMKWKWFKRQMCGSASSDISIVTEVEKRRGEWEALIWIHAYMACINSSLVCDPNQFLMLSNSIKHTHGCVATRDRMFASFMSKRERETEREREEQQ